MLPPRAYVFLGLNGVRVLSIIACLLVFSSSIVTMVHDVEAVNDFVAAGKANSTSAESLLACDYIADSTVPNQPAGAFWAVLNRLLITFQVIVLILSEIGWPLSFFNRFFPVLGSDFGLGALGVMQCLIGAAILSHHVDDFALVSAFFLFSLGCLNILLGLIFREHAKTKRSLTSWREQAKGILPPPVQRAASSSSTLFNSSLFSEKGAGNERKGRFDGYGFGRQAEKKANLKDFITRPVESLPRYAPRNRASSPPASA
ncbi:hypothetical protein EDB85DRAFT_2032044 [Lactarius pseudohatsudake]|nr:hypothetical protein EDB85DRAFT_2035445 [Lactarius pseudohatsudake]KAH9013765.1 hypothetical protein EDB85DRAFT_2032044 [Lactarius pseudohatsudake]